MLDPDKITRLLGDLKESEVNEALDEFIASNPTEESVHRVISACQRGMELVGAKFEDEYYFVGDLMYAAQIMNNAIGRLGLLITSAGNRALAGKMVLGTVAGDIHDIGKNIFGSLAEASGFEVVDIGIDKAPAVFVDAVIEHTPQIVGLSGVLTLSIESMRQTVEALKEADLKDRLLVMIGGNAATEESRIHTGADYCTRNAAAGVRKALEYVQAQ